MLFIASHSTTLEGSSFLPWKPEFDVGVTKLLATAVRNNLALITTCLLATAVCNLAADWQCTRKYSRLLPVQGKGSHLKTVSFVYHSERTLILTASFWMREQCGQPSTQTPPHLRMHVYNITRVNDACIIPTAVL